MLAVIKTGGKQYVVKKGDVIKVEKLPKNEEKKVIFDRVLLTSDRARKNISIGAPYVKGVKVEARVVRDGRAKKVKVVKYKPKTRYKRVLGHQQYFTEVEITKI